MIIETDLSSAGIERAIKQLENYKKELHEKINLFLQKLAEAGIEVVEDKIGEAGKTYDSKGIESGSDTTHNTYVRMTKDGAELVLEGQEVAFIEFGAGVHYNGNIGSSPNPLYSPDLGISGIGTYGKGHGRQETWGYRNGSQVTLSHGTKAAMPLFQATLEIADKFDEIAKEVFG